MGNLLFFGIADWIENAFYGICLMIDTMIYWAIAMVYRVFYLVSQASLFGDAELKAITDRVYVLLGVAMLFVFAYNILVLITNPDNMASKDDKSLTSIAKNLIISIVLLTFLPTAFKYLQVAQNSIMSSNVIGNIILGGNAVNANSTTTYNIKDAGTSTALTILNAFYHPVIEDEAYSFNDCEQIMDEANSGVCKEYVIAMTQASELSQIRPVTFNTTLQDSIADGNMEYYWIISTVAGCIAVYFFFSFALDVGVRVAKLGFLELIAPIPVALRITKPKGGTFDRWLDEFKKTYLQIFMRLAVIFFAMYAISLVPDLLSRLWQSGDGSLTGVGGGLIKLVSTVVVILGILKFAKDAPKLAEDIFKVEHVELNIGKKIGSNEYAMRGASAIGSSVGSMASGIANGQGFRGKVIGAAGGLFGGATNGWKNGNVSDVRQLGRAVNTSRAKTNASINGVNQKMDNLFGNSATGQAGDFLGTVGNDISGVAKGVGQWFTGEGISSPKLEAAKQANSMFDALFKNFESSYKQIDAAKDQAVKDLQGGKKIKLPTSYTDRYGVTHAAGTDIAATDISIKDVGKIYGNLKRDALTEKFQKADFGKSIQSYGDTICKQLTNTFGTLGSEAQARILSSAGITNISELEKVFAKAGDVSFTDTEMKKIMDISDAVGNEVKIQNLQVQSEKAKDKK